jgi:hypothetical protein
LAIVASAVAGDGLERVARSASEAVGHPVAIILPSLGAPVVWPAGAMGAGVLDELVRYAAGVTAGRAAEAPGTVAHATPIRIAQDVVGIVAAIAGTAGGEGSPSAPADDPAWLEAAAAAAAVTRLMRDGQAGEASGSAAVLVEALADGPPADAGALLDQARRLGFDLGAGAIAVCGRMPDGTDPEPVTAEDALIAQLGQERVVGLVPLGDLRAADHETRALADRLRAAGMEVGVSGPRRQPELLHEAVREAMLLAELLSVPDAAVAGQEDTYRLLIGVLVRDPAELELLRAHTISPLLAYDAEHDTELLGTLETFLARHGSTTETAEVMRLHRHTVGYRLTRVQEVSGLSPYESDGRERLSLGLKAAQILAADERLSQPG